jgi:hypothetical protein
MQKDNCERCHQPTNGVTTMSMFNEQTICIPCKEKERLHPDYTKASDAEIQAVRNGNRNFAGIGLPQNYQI